MIGAVSVLSNAVRAGGAFSALRRGHVLARIAGSTFVPPPVAPVASVAAPHSACFSTAAAIVSLQHAWCIRQPLGGMFAVHGIGSSAGPTTTSVRFYGKQRKKGGASVKKKPEKRRKWPRFNNEIIADTVRLIDAEGEQVGIMSAKEAQKLAKSKRLDLVQFSAQNEPVVCKIMDWAGEQRRVKRVRAQRLKAAASTSHKQKKVKRMPFTARIADHDLAVKTSKIERMLNKGHAVRVSVNFQGLEPWRQQEIKRRAVIRSLMDNLEGSSHWLARSLKADQFALHAVVQPASGETGKIKQDNDDVRALLENPIWPANIAKAELARLEEEDRASGGKSAMPSSGQGGLDDDSAETDATDSDFFDDEDDSGVDELDDFVDGDDLGDPTVLKKLDPYALVDDADEIGAAPSSKPRRRRTRGAAAQLTRDGEVAE